MPDFFSFRYKDGILQILDQRKIPVTEEWIKYTGYREVAKAITDMVVRGAPAIGCVAAYGYLLGAREAANSPDFDAQMNKVYSTLAATRPTAVNLFWALNRMKSVPKTGNFSEYINLLESEAEKIATEDVSSCKNIGKFGAEAIKGENLSILTHCNAGALATADYGTALGVIRTLSGQKRLKRVYADDTRPRQQGGRLTTWELMKDNIPVTLIPDTAAGLLMSKGKIDAVVTGADRIAVNGDSANKIGTYSIAILAKYHNIPMYIAAPLSTFDPNASTGKDIPIEERDANEVRMTGGHQTAPLNVPVFNPAFDVTPAGLITAIITDKGVIYPPFRENIQKLLNG